MAGFGAGFGRGFSQGWGLADQAIQRRERDSWRAFYDNYTRKQDRLSRLEAEQSKHVALVDSVFSTYGEGLPVGAKQVAYQKLASGEWDRDDLTNALKTGQFKPGPSEVPAGQTDRVQGAGAEAEQMMQEQQPPVSSPHVIQAPTITEDRNLFEKGLELAQSNWDINTARDPKTQLEANINRLVNEQGVDPEHARRVMEEVGLPDPYENVNNVQFVPGAQNYTPQEQSNLLANQKELRTAAAPVEEKANKYRTIADNANNAYRIADSEPAVLARGVTGLAGMIASGSLNVSEGLRVFFGQGDLSNLTDAKTTGSGEVDAMASELKNQVGEYENIVASSNDVNAKATLFQLYTVLAAYDLASSRGQEGRALSEEERKIFLDLMQTSKGPEAYKAKMEELLRGEARGVQREIDSYNKIVDRMEKQFNSTKNMDSRPYDWSQEKLPDIEELNIGNEPKKQATRNEVSWSEIENDPDVVAGNITAEALAKRLADEANVKVIRGE